MPEEKAPDKELREWICRENIKNLRAQYALTCDEARRKMLLTLLAEQEAQLEQLVSDKRTRD